jgi:hypothetical protein
MDRLIGSIRRELLDHVIILNEGHWRRLLSAYLKYSHQGCPHMGPGHNAPEPRAVESQRVTRSLPSRWWVTGITVLAAARAAVAFPRLGFAALA